MKNIYPNLAAEMARKKITQKKLGEILGLNPVAIHSRLKGKTDFKLVEICKIMNFFNSAFDYIFDTDVIPNKK